MMKKDEMKKTDISQKDNWPNPVHVYIPTCMRRA